jgi:lipoprotein-releasing system permease protein
LDSEVYLLDTLPVDWQPVDIAVVSLTALAICFIATIYPARKASMMHPVEAIRND